jgi:non-ribosomal peptide synthase protein (TIGR01720 family)
LRRALVALVEHHDALRLRYRRSASGEWARRVLEPGACSGEAAVAFRVVDALATDEGSAMAFDRSVSERGELNLELGPLLSATLFQPPGGEPGYLLLAPHHLCIDGASWRLLLDDLDQAYRLADAGQAVKLPANTASLARWSRALEAYAQSEGLRAELSHWARAAEGRTELPLDEGLAHERTERTTRVLERTYPHELSDGIARSFGARTESHLLSCLLVAVNQWTHHEVLTVELEGHGRESVLELDVTRTMGWFTTIYPVTVRLGSDRSPEAVLSLVERSLASVPRHGFGYGALRYLHHDPRVRAVLASQRRPSLRFNYLGRFDSMANESSAFEQRLDSHIPGSRDPDGMRPNLLRLDALILDGQLRTVWTYSESCHRRSTIESLAETFDQALKVLMRRAERAAPRFAGSDRRVQLSASDMDALLSELAVGRPR